MNSYARVVDGLVIEVVTLPYSDTPDQYFPPDLPGEWIETADATVKSLDTYAGGEFTPQQIVIPPDHRVTALLNDGIVITSSSRPEVNGTYAMDDATRPRVTGEALYVQTTTTNQDPKFTNGQATKPWPDKDGDLHVFDLVSFMDFAEAVAEQYDVALTWGHAGALDPAPVLAASI